MNPIRMPSRVSIASVFVCFYLASHFSRLMNKPTTIGNKKNIPIMIYPPQRPRRQNRQQPARRKQLMQKLQNIHTQETAYTAKSDSSPRLSGIKRRMTRIDIQPIIKILNPHQYTAFTSPSPAPINYTSCFPMTPLTTVMYPYLIYDSGIKYRGNR